MPHVQHMLHALQGVKIKKAAEMLLECCPKAAGPLGSKQHKPGFQFFRWRMRAQGTGENMPSGLTAHSAPCPSVTVGDTALLPLAYCRAETLFHSPSRPHPPHQCSQRGLRAAGRAARSKRGTWPAGVHTRVQPSVSLLQAHIPRHMHALKHAHTHTHPLITLIIVQESGILLAYKCPKQCCHVLGKAQHKSHPEGE